MSGFIKIHRSIIEWEWYSDLNTRALFIHLLLTANYKTSRFRGMDVPAGSKVTGLKALSEQTSLSVSQIRTALKKLERTGEIAIKSHNKFSIISITNWKKYQDSDKQIANKSQTNDKQIATSKEGKKERKKEIYTRPADVSETTWSDFKKLRSAKKAPITETAMKKIRSEAEKANWTLEAALQETCANGWQGFQAKYVQGKAREGPKRGYQGM